MELTHSFTVPVGVEEAWTVLRDIQRVAPCMPGATIDSVDGEDFTGRVKVKVGPITVQYRGEASFVDVDDAAHTARIEARGQETRGSGTARATVSVALATVPDGTEVHLVTDLAITGKPAQFGRSVMADIGAKLIGQFADCLSGQLAASDEPAPEPAVEGPRGEHIAIEEFDSIEEFERSLDGGLTPAANEPASTVSATADPTPTTAPPVAPPRPQRASAPTAPRPTPDAIDLLDVAGAPLLGRLTPVLLGAAVGALLTWLLTGRRRS